MTTPQNHTYVIGIDGGGTRTSFVILDSHLREVARTSEGQSNYQISGAAIQDVLRDGIAEALNLANLTIEQIAAIGAGFSGVDRSADRQKVTAIFEAICPGVRLVLDNDATPALIAGVGRRFGVLTICGTGMIALGYNDAGERARSGGWGYHVDQGSGYWIAREALHAIGKAHDGGGLQTGITTAITGRVLQKLGLATPHDLVAWLYASERKISEIAALAEDVVSVESTDAIAAGIISRAADALAESTIMAARQLGFTDQRFPVVLAGSLFVHSALLRDLFTAAVMAALPGAAVSLPERDAATGAAMMALEASGITFPQLDLVSEAASRRATEKRNALTIAIQQRPTLDFVTLMNIEDQRVPRLMVDQLPTIAALIDAIAERFIAGGRIFMVGAGTSGRLAVLDAAECFPTFNVSGDLIAGILAGGLDAMVNSLEGAEDDEQDGRKQIAARGVGKQDTVIGIAASGGTPFVIGALREATDRGALTGCVVNNAGTIIPTLVQHPIIIPTGAEVIMGSTRLKAGTAQKMALNMISTGVMVRVGRTFGNLMTDMRSSNIKLRKRSGVIVAEATGLPLDQAVEVLDRSGGEIKTAIVAALLKVDPETARERLNSCGGNIARCVQMGS